MDRLDPDDVRIVVVVLSLQWIRLSLQLEQIVIRELVPPYRTSGGICAETYGYEVENG